MAVIGIDLGTTNSLAAVWTESGCKLIPNSLGEFLTPSVVSVEEDGTVFVGKIARERLITDPARTASSFKRFMGTEHSYRLGNRTFLAEDLSACVLRQLKADAEAFLKEEVTEAVISVPAYFNDNQRCATKLAGQLAGLKVERLVNEPSAASLAYRQNNPQEEQRFLVFDFGGGTLDISVVDAFNNVIEIIAVAGDNHLGGDDFNQAVAEAFCKANGLVPEMLGPKDSAIVLRQAEQCKISLTDSPVSAMIWERDGRTYSMTMNNNDLIKAAAPLFVRIAKPIRRALQDSGLSPEDIDRVILVGGSSKMPAVRSYLQHLLEQTPLCSIPPDTAVAIGAGVAAGIKERRKEIRDTLLTDICPFTLGVGVHNEADTERPLFSPLIERNTVLPASREGVYSTVADNQTSIRLSIFQGESRMCENNLRLGELSVNVPMAPRGSESVSVRFTYDINGILEVEMQSLTTKATVRKVFVNQKLNLSEQEVERRLAQLAALKVHPRDKERNKLLTSRGERLFEESLGQAREEIAGYLNYFNHALSTQNEREIEKAYEVVSAYFDAAEERQEEPFAMPEEY